MGLAGLAILVIPAGAQKAPEKLTVGPVSYFEAHCSRCHGPNGSFYDLQQLSKLSDAKLRKFVVDMAMGAGNAPLRGSDIDAQVAYHRAMIRNKPFLAVTSISGGFVKGEAYGADKIFVLRSGASASVGQDSKFQLRAKVGAKLAASAIGKSEIEVGKQAFNQRNPLP